jgi:hypothetical protein
MSRHDHARPRTVTTFLTRPRHGIGPILIAVIGFMLPTASGRLQAEQAQSAPARIADDVAGTFEDITAPSGVGGGGTVAWSDFDNDGHVDVVSGGKLYRNQGDGTFAAVEGISASRGVWADIDNDGLLDYYAAEGKGKLLRNLGDGRFEERPIPANVHEMSQAAAWADANNDGFVDLFVTNYEIWPTNAFPDLLYMSNGDGTFAEPVVYPPKWRWRARGVNWSDFDDDGDQDLYVSNYRLQPNQLWVNDGMGKFTDEAKARGVLGTDDEENIGASSETPAYKASGHTIGSCFGDVNNDGHIDLIVVNFAHSPAHQDRTMVCINSGPPDHTFTNINDGNKAGIHYQESYAKGALGDYDNDGDLDLYITTVDPGDNGTLFENDGTGRFKDVGDKTSTRGCNSYGVAWSDIDNDGDLDLFAGGKLLRNRGNNNAWVRVKVVGDGRSNRAGIGGRVMVHAADKTYLREIQAGNSGNQNDPNAHVGLGKHEGPVRIEVRFPSGTVVSRTTPARQVVTIKESQILQQSSASTP